MNKFKNGKSLLFNAAFIVATLFLFGPVVYANVTATPNPAIFPNQGVGSADGVSISLTNTWRRPTTIVSASVSPAEFSLSGLSLPFTLSLGQNVMITVNFLSDSTQSFSGTLTLTNDYGGTMSVSLNAIANAPVLLSSDTTAVNFGNVTLANASGQNVNVTNTGSSSISISEVLISGPGFSAGGLPAGTILAPGQSAPLNVGFAPTVTGGAAGSVTVVSTATNSPTTITLSGTGTAPIAPTVALTWTPSASSVIGYNAYSSSVSGGPYQKLNDQPIASYTDATVQSGNTYYYVVTSVDSNNSESAYSNEVSVSVP